MKLDLLNPYFLLATLITAFYFIFKLRHDLHMLQQNGYRNDRYTRWLNNDQNRIIQKSDIMYLIGLLPVLLPSFFPSLSHNVKIPLFIAGLPFMALSIFMFHVSVTYQPAKKKLVYTPRVKRLFVSAAALGILALVLQLWANRALFSLVLMAFMITYSSLFALLANIVNAPAEGRIRGKFIQSAKDRLNQRNDRIIAGITGSYGKTSVKHILTELTSRRFNVLMTPGSFNTTLGVVKTINEQLNSTHDLFVVEMGAKETGDIKEICDIVPPDYAIITSIGPQHLETFGSIENVAATKGELFRGVKPGGVIALNAGDPLVAGLPRRSDVRYLTYGAPGSDCTVSDVQITGSGTTFTLRANTGQGQIVETFSTQLLGAHNIDNMLGAIAIALDLGVPVRDIHRALKDMKPVQHRLSSYRAGGGWLVLDDAFNSNPTGSSNALEVLKAIEGGKKLIMTPGMIELGDEQDALNERFGEKIAGVCDDVILVGPKRTAPIARGIRSMGFPEERLHIVKNLKEGFEMVQQLAGPGDVLLIENDLPDSYNE
jgi:UDP-N-acetylmuramoyl-tripeptide--D-alanyl-D-alanine ligase